LVANFITRMNWGFALSFATPALRALMDFCPTLAAGVATALALRVRFTAIALVFAAALRRRPLAIALALAAVGRATDFFVLLVRGAAVCTSLRFFLAPSLRIRSEVVAERLPRVRFGVVRDVRIFFALLVLVTRGPRPADATGAATSWSASARVSARGPSKARNSLGTWR
jgi:hypothetical protein